jgi:hypothetical protein
MQMLIERGAVMRKLASVPKPVSREGALGDAEAYEVIIEAEIDCVHANALVEALGEVSRRGGPVMVAIKPEVGREGERRSGELHGERAPQEVKWGDFLITM